MTGFLSLTTLTLDLLSRPTRCVLGARRELLVRASVARHVREPFALEVLAVLAAWEGFRDVAAAELAKGFRACGSELRGVLPDNAHGRSQKSFGPVRILVHRLQQLEDGLNVWLQQVGYNMVSVDVTTG